MEEFANRWDPYSEVTIDADRDPVLDDPIIYGVTVPQYTVTVYHPNGDVLKYWNARILKDLLGYARIACPRDNKILKFNWIDWTVYLFTKSGMNELVFMPDSSKKTVTTLLKEVK